MLTLLLIGLASQSGYCRPGVACQTQSVTTSAPASTNALVMQEGSRVCLNPNQTYTNPDGGAALSNRCGSRMFYKANQGQLIVYTDAGVSIFVPNASSLTTPALDLNGGLIKLNSSNAYVYGSGTGTRMLSVVTEAASGATAYGVGTTGARYCLDSACATYLYGDGASVISVGTLYSTGALTIAPGAPTLNAPSTAGVRAPLQLLTGYGVKIQNIATASLPELDGGFEGVIFFDTTLGKLRVVSGNAYQTVTSL